MVNLPVFFGLVLSGTTAKQLDKETDARFAGCLGVICEGTLALIRILAWWPVSG